MIRWVAALSRWLSASPGPSLDELAAAGGFVALDFETTGLDTRRDAIVAVAAIPFLDGMPRGGCVTLVNPGRPIPAASTAIHGITDADVAAAPSLGDVMPALDAALDERVIVGHDVAFDIALLRRARHTSRRAPVSNLFLDTRGLAAALHPGWRDLDLDDLVTRLGVGREPRHTAAGDALMAGRVFLALLPALSTNGVPTVRAAMRVQRRHAGGRHAR